MLCHWSKRNACQNMRTNDVYHCHNCISTQLSILLLVSTMKDLINWKFEYTLYSIHSIILYHCSKLVYNPTNFIFATLYSLDRIHHPVSSTSLHLLGGSSDCFSCLLALAPLRPSTSTHRHFGGKMLCDHYLWRRINPERKQRGTFNEGSLCLASCYLLLSSQNGPGKMAAYGTMDLGQRCKQLRRKYYWETKPRYYRLCRAMATS